MIRNESYFATPDFQPTVSQHDTRTPNDPRNFATKNNGAVHAFRDPFAICVWRDTQQHREPLSIDGAKLL